MVENWKLFLLEIQRFLRNSIKTMSFVDDLACLNPMFEIKIYLSFPLLVTPMKDLAWTTSSFVLNFTNVVRVNRHFMVCFFLKSTSCDNVQHRQYVFTGVVPHLVFFFRTTQRVERVDVVTCIRCKLKHYTIMEVVENVDAHFQLP